MDQDATRHSQPVPGMPVGAQERPVFDLVEPSAPPRPRVPGGVVLRPDPDALIDAMLADLYIHARNCVRVFGDFHLAIAFWPQIEPAVRRLLYDLNFRDFPWERTRVWLVDELAVSTRDPRSRRASMEGLIVAGAGLPPEQAHAIDAHEPDAPSQYERTLREHLGWREKGHDRLDFVLVPQLHDGAWGGVADWSEDDPHAPLVVRTPAGPSMPAGVAMTTRLVHAARFIAIYAIGAEAGPGLETWRGRFALSRLGAVPTQDSAEVRWYVDHAAARAVAPL